MKDYYQYQKNFSYYNSNNNSVREFSNNPKLYSSSEGYQRGNMFSDLYTPYKNYQPYPLRASNEEDALYLKLSENDFAAHDLNLYLDLHPQDGNALDLFNQYRSNSNSLLEQFESSYFPITVSSNALNTSPFMWEENSFPWNEGGI